ncbi:hypothetical protein [Pseudogemmobacter faecipullorum]|uniref:Transposase n=1 Tax=Pseudogemmobacter faecipullorum TaxID=2755041 RepID=A0ABS8CQ41_9RHOB|nr:hypothetical protein [Pseudogemmobacter faecipullorum]MCB5411516.1 hypothetical protein [Pseudogemmobacter faecipullorum]
MGKRQTFTEAQLSRAVKVAEKHGKVAIQTHLGIAFIAPEAINHTATTENAADAWFRENGQDSSERY